MLWLSLLFLLFLTFLMVSGLTWVICWAFGFVFSWKLVIGIWAICILIKQFTGYGSGR